MSDLRDFRFDAAPTGPEDFETGPVGPDDDREPSRRTHWGLAAGIAVAVIVIGLLIFWFTRPEKEAELVPPKPDTAAAEATSEQAEPEPSPPLVLPDLEASDALVGELVSTLSAHPRLVAWLATDDLVRRFTVSIVNIAEGATPKTHLGVLALDEPFSTSSGLAGLQPSTRSYARYDRAAEVFTSLDVPGTVRLYEQLKPLIDEAFLELGYPGEDFHRKLVAALDHLLATPDVESDVALVQTVTAYRFADPELEELSAAQKQLLRMGPDNVRKVQAQLRALRRELVEGGDG